MGIQQVSIVGEGKTSLDNLNDTASKNNKITVSTKPKVGGKKSKDKSVKILPERHFKIVQSIQGLNKLKLNKELLASTGRMLGLPNRIRLDLKYSTFATHTHTSGAIQEFDFRGNSVFDPDYTYGGHQPVYFDQIALVYMYYRVKSCHIKVSIHNLTSGVPATAVIVPVRELNPVTAWSAYSEQSLAKTISVNDIGGPTTVITGSMSTARIFDGQLELDQDFGSLVTTNPAKQWYWVLVTNSTNSASTSSCIVQVELVYDVEFSQNQFLDVS